MADTPTNAPRVLISYSHDSEAHKRRVLELADRLCREDVEVRLDQYEHPPPPSWPRWMMDEIEAADFVLIVSTETYNRRFRGHEEPGRGKGVTWEGVIITHELYNAHCKTIKFIPVVFDPEDETHIPIILQGGTPYRVSDEGDYRCLCRILTDQPATPRPPRGERVQLPPERPLPASPDPETKPSNLPFLPNPHFTGRADLLEELHRQLAERPTPAITQPQALHGLGGVGKTQLAVEYAWKHRAEYDAVLWVVADSAENAAANLAALCRPDVLGLKEADANEQDAQVEATLRWLRENSRWLLIFDSVDTAEGAEAVRNLLSPQWAGHVIVTSRRTDWPPTISPLSVDVLAEGEGAEFLRERSRARGFDAGPEADARALARELGRLPLALEQAAAYVLRHRVTFADYLGRLKNTRPELLKEEVEGSTRYPKSVAETWLLSERQLSPVARAVLRLAAFLAPDEIPRALFGEEHDALADAVRTLAGEERKGSAKAKKPLDAEAALVELADHSLVTLTPQTFSCHRLVQAAQADRLEADVRRRWAELALRLVNDYVPSDVDDVRAWPIMEAVRAHAETVVAHADKLGITDPTARLMNQLSVFLTTKALHREAEPLMRRALAIDEESFGPDHPKVAIRLNNLATSLQATNRLGEAEPLMRRALTIDEEGFGPDHPTVAIDMNNLALLLQATNRLGEAEPLVQRVVDIFEKALGESHPDVAVALNNLAQLLQDTNRLGEAEPLMRRALAIDEESFGPDHPKVARDLNNLAQLLKATNRLGEAEPLMQRVVDISEKALGESHPDVAVALNNLAQLLQDTNRLGEAEPLMRRHVVIFRKFSESTGHEHPHMQAAIRNYRALLGEQGLPEQEIRRRVQEAAGE